MALGTLRIFLVLAFLGWTAAGQTRGPVVEDFTPKILSINSVLELHGYRLFSSDPEQIKIYFFQNGNTYSARTGGGSSVTNDQHNGKQTLEVIVPEEVLPGPAQVVVKTKGLRTGPITVTIVEWKLPELKNISPKLGSPDTDVFISCVGLHINDEIELTDAAGKVTRIPSGASSHGTSFRVPKDAAEGLMMVRVGSSNHGDRFTEAVKFVVTNDPLPIELAPGSMTSVAPGQWLDLQMRSTKPLKLSELTEIAFKQAGRTIVVATPNPRRPHVAVPSALSPGPVQLQTRTWRNGNPSIWSNETSFRLAETPVPLSVEAIRLEKGTWVHLWPGPDKPQSFDASAGDAIVLNGSFRAVDASKLKVLLTGSAGTIELNAAELDPKAEWFGEVVVKLPDTLARGDWRMSVTNTDDGTQFEVPMVIRIK